MIAIGRRRLNESVIRLCSTQNPQAFVARALSSLISTSPAGMHTNSSPGKPNGLPASRHFAASSAEQYNPQGEMSAVTFHGPRTMKVSKKAKPRLETPGVSTCQLQLSALTVAVLQTICSIVDGEHATQCRNTVSRPHALQDVIVKVTMASICGSDMHPYAGRGVPLDHGITFGHEYTGVIVAAGDDVSLHT